MSNHMDSKGRARSPRPTKAGCDDEYYVYCTPGGIGHLLVHISKNPKMLERPDSGIISRRRQK